MDESDDIPTEPRPKVLAAEEIISALQEMLWDVRSRELLQKHGLNLVPADFYSNVPTLLEISESFEYRSGDPPPYLDRKIFDERVLTSELNSLVPFAHDFDPEVEGDEENCTTYFWRNSQFSYSDAAALFAYIRKIKPKTVVEIGSGFSSLVTLDALDRNGSGRLICIEPYPRPFIKAHALQNKIDLREIPAQALTPEMLNAELEDGDILFIDSTHTVKTGSDCLNIYLRLVPHIRKRLLIHIHDIFLPFGLPLKWVRERNIHWTEQYLVLAWMIDNPKVRLLYGSAYLQHFNRPLLESLMRGRWGSGGASFWVSYNGAL